MGPTIVNLSMLLALLAANRASSEKDKDAGHHTVRDHLKISVGHFRGENGTPSRSYHESIRGAIFGGHGMSWERDSRAIVSSKPGDFSLYIFAMSWKAEWCYHQSYPGCKTPREFWEDNLTIHGLWPDNGDGTYPTKCTSEKFDHDRVVDAVGMDVLEDVWPNIQVAEDTGRKYDSFWEHEWSKHGTCTGLSQDQYFSAGVALLKERFTTPEQLAADAGATITRAELEDAYGGEGMAVLQCDGHTTKYLNQVFLCLEVDAETHMPGEQVVCPELVVSHDDSCGQGDIHVGVF